MRQLCCRKDPEVGATWHFGRRAGMLVRLEWSEGAGKGQREGRRGYGNHIAECLGVRKALAFTQRDMRSHFRILSTA